MKKVKIVITYPNSEIARDIKSYFVKIEFVIHLGDLQKVIEYYLRDNILKIEVYPL